MLTALSVLPFMQCKIKKFLIPFNTGHAKSDTVVKVKSGLAVFLKMLFWRNYENLKDKQKSVSASCWLIFQQHQRQEGRKRIHPEILTTAASEPVNRIFEIKTNNFRHKLCYLGHLLSILQDAKSPCFTLLFRSVIKDTELTRGTGVYHQSNIDH